MKRRKSLLFIGAAIVCSLPLGSKADFSGFVDQLRQSNIPIDKILTQTGITRYEITRLLNATECKDCINPDNSYLKTYTAPYWTKFTQTPGKDFDDISYAQAMFKNKSYYYCVAYVGENGYMRGYPADTSPICAGQFCGTRQATKAEFLQIVMNMISKYIYSSYALNWQEVKTWLSKLDSNGYQYKNFSSTDIQTISDKAKTCKTQSCLLENSNDLNIYLKYCTFNLQACGMASVGPIKEGSWPVAELNLLSKQQIINLDDAAKFNIGDLIDGQLIIKIFANMNDLIGCAFINDYDCDGITNSQDSCPNAYNPHQTDTDKDGIGDVCDDDIDGDGAKNPIGIVDDNGRIVIRLWDKAMDNCLFVNNKDQKHPASSRIGNACSISDNLSLAISITNPDIKTNHTISFTAVYKNTFKEYSRDFGDGAFGFGEKTSHTYQKPGTYTVRLIAKTDSGKQSLARSSVIIGHAIDEERAIQPVLNALSFQNNSSIDLSLSTIGTVDYFEWSFGDGVKTQTKTASLTKLFRTDASIPVTIKGIKDNQIVSANTFTIAIGTNKGALLNASLLNPNKGETVYFSSKISGFGSKDIKSVVWSFGDGESLQTDVLSINHVYKVSGQKAVVQTISLHDGTILKNIITLYVVSPYFFDSYTLSFVPQMESDLIHALKFTTTIFGSFDTPLFFSSIYGDGQSQNFGTRAIRSPFISEHRYISPDIYYPQTTLMLNSCTSLSAQATVDIQGSDICLDAKLNNTLNKLGCDSDKDNIPDICDDDIDNDGKPNLLGIIVDPKTCTKQNNTLQGINTDILNKHFQGVCSLDNDPFTNNPDQTDNNNNNIGDSLDTINILGSGTATYTTSFLDTDNDGIPDSQDLCPSLSETYNGIQDTDGCPEIGAELNCENTQFPTINGDRWNGNGSGGNDGNSGENTNVPSCGNGIQESNENCFSCPQDSQGCLMIMTQECLQCPCPFADFSADLTNGDLVKAILWDKTKKYPWSYSVGYEIGY